MLIQRGYPPAVILATQRRAYLKALRLADAGNRNPLARRGDRARRERRIDEVPHPESQARRSSCHFRRSPRRALTASNIFGRSSIARSCAQCAMAGYGLAREHGSTSIAFPGTRVAASRAVRKAAGEGPFV